jgi:hypothetical protein
MYPPPLLDVKPNHVEMWRQLRENVTDSRLRARLDDLLWLRGLDDAYQRALSAVDEYLGIAVADSPGFRQVQALQRAADISVRIKDSDLLAKAIAQVIAAIADSLSAEQPKPGITFRLLEILLRLPVQTQPAEIDSLVVDADAVFGADPWHHQTVLEMQRQRASSPDARREAERAQVETWATAGREAEGVQRHSHLMRAVELAREYGLGDVAEHLRREVQELQHDDLGLQEISSQVQIPVDQLQRQADWVASGEDWVGCLDRLVGMGPLTGSYEANVALVRKNAEEFVFQQLMPQQVIGPFNLPIHTAFSEEEKEELALAQHEALSLDLWSIFVTDALDLIAVRHGAPVASDLGASFVGDVVPEHIAERFASAVVHHSAGRYDEAVHVILPRVEAATRHLARAAGLAVAKEPTPGKPIGGVQPLGSLLESLAGVLPEDWRRHLRALLTNPLSLNLRNNYLHGLIAVGDRRHSALLIHAAAFMARLRPATQNRGEGG